LATVNRITSSHQQVLRRAQKRPWQGQAQMRQQQELRQVRARGREREGLLFYRKRSMQ